MKLKATMAMAMVSMLALSGCQLPFTKAAAKKIDLTNQTEKLSYSLGVSVGKSIKSQGADKIDSAAVAQALDDVFNSKTLQVSQTDANAFLNTFFSAQAPKIAAANTASSQAFLDNNKKIAGITTTTSGLQYKVTTPGTGATPNATDTVTINYTGTLIDGTIFDSSATNGQPATFQVDGVIKGLTEGLQLMKVGAKYTFYIPSAIAYGSTGTTSGSIGPNEALIFEVELVSIAAPAATTK